MLSVIGARIVRASGAKKTCEKKRSADHLRAFQQGEEIPRIEHRSHECGHGFRHGGHWDEVQESIEAEYEIDETEKNSEREMDLIFHFSRLRGALADRQEERQSLFAITS
jgi:hypothetical protein